MLLFIRDGLPILRTPQKRDSDVVPEDFIVLVGIATAFLDPGFRSMMKAIVREHAENGMLDRLFTSDEPALH